MKFEDILSRITGFTTPIFGVSWKPPEIEREAIRKLLLSFEDRRVLYNPVRLIELREIAENISEETVRAAYAATATPMLFPIRFAATDNITSNLQGALTRVVKNQAQTIFKRHMEIFSAVQLVREEISSVLLDLPQNSKAIAPLRSMRAACRRFLNNDPNSSGSDVAVALGELRGTFGTQLAFLAVQYGLDIDGELSSIIPAEDE